MGAIILTPRYFFLHRQSFFRPSRKSGFGSVCCCILFTVMVIGTLFLLPATPSAQVQEEPLKSIILEKILGYIFWPEHANATDDEMPLFFGVLGESPFSDFLLHTYEQGQRVVGQKKVKVRSIKKLAEIDKYDVVFIAGDKEQLLDDILIQAEGKPVLLVGDTKGFGYRGIHINFYESRNKIRFELNKDAAENCGLKIDFRLKNIAKIVGSRPGGIK